MPRKIRVEHPDVINRGERSDDSFHNDIDRPDSLTTLAEAWQIRVKPRNGNADEWTPKGLSSSAGDSLIRA